MRSLKKHFKNNFEDSNFSLISDSVFILSVRPSFWPSPLFFLCQVFLFFVALFLCIFLEAQKKEKKGQTKEKKPL